MVQWLKDAIFYQIYPTSFFDSDNDGTGDLRGITAKLDYIADVGFNAVWINPFYPSPFKDGGYDISDYCNVDKRFGTLDDFDNLVAECKKRGIKVVLDLVIGHTSTEHKWFVESAKYNRNAYSDYYIWTDSNLEKYKDKTIHGLFDRDGGYYINYYACQPALNFGFNSVDKVKKNGSYQSSCSWQMRYDDERLQPLRNQVLDVMRFWLNRGVDGFRVDMANSLVKGCVYNSDKTADVEGIVWLWKKIIPQIKSEYPSCAFISEWVYAKNAVAKAGFDVDFYAHDIDCYNSLFRYEKGSNLLDCFEKGTSYFSQSGQGSATDFVKYYTKDLLAIQGAGYVSVPSGSHDQIRLAKNKSHDLLKTVFAFLLTIKHVPFVYYGDEIGMSHTENINRDGGYKRTGARTPMQWNKEKNYGFSNCEQTYLPVGSACDVNVKDQLADDNSLLNCVKKLIALRKKYSCLNADGEITFDKVKNNGYPLTYVRSDKQGKLLVAINPSEKPCTIKNGGRAVYLHNAVENDGTMVLNGYSFAVMEV